MAGKMLFYYFGDDEAYYRALLGEFKKHTRLDIDFQRIYESKEKNIQSLFLNVFRNRPAAVFIDFSKQPQDYLHLARIITRTPLEHKIASVGLIDYLSPPEVLLESIATGVNLTHIKSAEIYDVIFSVVKLIAPGEIAQHGFATAKLSEDWEAGIPVKIGYVHSDGIHFETDQKLQKGDRIRFNHNWTNNRVVPSKEFFIQEVSNTNMFYHFKYNVDAEFLFIDDFLPPEGMDEEKIKEKKQDREDLILYHRKQLSKWMDDNLSNSLEKKAKVLVIDHDFHFYDHQSRTDKHAYIIRCVPHLVDIGEELDRLQPQVIAFALEKEDVKNPKNTSEQLGILVQALKKKFEGTEPFLIVFNSKMGSREVQAQLQYSHLMATDHELSAEILLRMAEIYEKKLAARTVMTKPKVKGHKKVFLKKTSPASIGEILISVKICKLSESDMIIQSETPLPIGLNLHLTTPVDMFVNIQPTKTQGKIPEYHGLIHSIGEQHKKSLRHYVNSVFFREHDAKLNDETEQFKKLNETKMIEKEKALQAQLEAEAQEKADEKEENESSEESES